jgi:tRNA nucleotidyltransferase (CCA-adding enzyme)
MISKKIVKSKASRVHPSQAAIHAIHWSLVGSFHQGTWLTASVDIAMCKFLLFRVAFRLFFRALCARHTGDGPLADP